MSFNDQELLELHAILRSAIGGERYVFGDVDALQRCLDLYFKVETELQKRNGTTIDPETRRGSGLGDREAPTG